MPRFKLVAEDVTIPVSSSDATEGAVDKTSLTFTNLNWNVDQTVTVTGVDDFVADSNQDYSIVLGTAYSADDDYNGPDPADVTVINVDDDSRGGADDDSRGGYCFIATAAYGSSMDWHVRILSEFRNKRLLSNQIGRRLVNIYYKLSPPVADYLRYHPAPRAAVRCALIPITSAAYLAVHVHPLILLASLFIFLFIAKLCFRHLRLLGQK